MICRIERLVDNVQRETANTIGKNCGRQSKYTSETQDIVVGVVVVVVVVVVTRNKYKDKARQSTRVVEEDVKTGGKRELGKGRKGQTRQMKRLKMHEKRDHRGLLTAGWRSK